MRQKKNIDKLLVLMFFIGLSILLYPAIANFWNSKYQSKAVYDYDSYIRNLKEDDFSDLFKEAEDYNKSLLDLSFPFTMYNQIPNHGKPLNVDDKGIMGYVSIDKIRVELPIYYGTSDTILNRAAGHLEGSSLPIGGESTHSVVTAHRGLPSSKLFTDLDKLEIGDTFSFTVLNKKITYEIEEIKIVRPNEVMDLRIVEGEDYATLFTCTPYGINTHRLLTIGKRVGTDILKDDLFIRAEAFVIDPIIIVPFIAIPVLVILFVYLVLDTRKEDDKNEKKI